jgi:peptide/nickel transport system substrate-binding protein
MKRRDLLASSALGLGLGLPGTGGPALAQGAAPRKGGALTMALFPEPATLLSANSASHPVQLVGAKIYDALVRLDENFEMQPVLAKSWEIAPDALSWTFQLRENATWHDGRPFTSADVAFTMMEVWKKLHPRQVNTFRNVTAVETPGPHTVVFRLSAPIPFMKVALSAYDATMVARHLYEGTDILNNPHNLKPVGTGPFRFREWVRGSHMVLERNPTYWDAGKPYLDRLVIRFIPDAAGRAAALENGEVMLASPNQIPLIDAGRLADVPELDVNTKGNGFFAPIIYLQYNMTHPILGRKEVRQALAHAVDQEFIVRNMLFGFGAAAPSPIHPSQKAAFTADLPRYDFDLAKAGRLLDAAGLPLKDGTRFAITLDPYATAEEYVRIGEYLRQSFGKIGVKVTLRTEDPAGWNRRVANYDYDAAVYGAVLLGDPTIGMQRFFHSGAIRKGSPWVNWSQYRNARVDQLFDLCQVEADPARRTAHWHEMQRILQDELPLYTVAYQDYVNVVNRKLRGWQTSPHSFFENFAGVSLA